MNVKVARSIIAFVLWALALTETAAMLFHATDFTFPLALGVIALMLSAIYLTQDA